MACQASRSRRPIVLSRQTVHRDIDADQTTLRKSGCRLRFTYLVAEQLAADGNPPPPDLRNETLTVLVAKHEAPPGTRPVDVSEFKTAAGWPRREPPSSTGSYRSPRRACGKANLCVFLTHFH